MCFPTVLPSKSLPFHVPIFPIVIYIEYIRGFGLQVCLTTSFTASLHISNSVLCLSPSANYCFLFNLVLLHPPLNLTGRSIQLPHYCPFSSLWFSPPYGMYRTSVVLYFSVSPGAHVAADYAIPLSCSILASIIFLTNPERFRSLQSQVHPLQIHILGFIDVRFMLWGDNWLQDFSCIIHRLFDGVDYFWHSFFAFLSLLHIVLPFRCNHTIPPFTSLSSYRCDLFLVWCYLIFLLL